MTSWALPSPVQKDTAPAGRWMHATQTAFWQFCPLGQAMPQPPQFFASLVMSTSQPLRLPPSQLAEPGTRLANMHVRSTQRLRALGMNRCCDVPLAFPDLSWARHATPQALELRLSLARVTSQPFTGLPSQSAKPG